MAFLKFIDKKGADSFISGIVQFGRLKEYLYIEKKKCVGKNDEMEGDYEEKSVNMIFYDKNGR